MVSLADERDRARAQGLKAFPPELAKARRARMRELGTRCPGALRELQSTSATRLAERLARVHALVSGNAEAHVLAGYTLWANAVHLYQHFLQVALGKRSLGQTPAPGLRVWAVERVACELRTTSEAVVQLLDG
ncbi:MAG: hypothetical protein HY904_18585 [Deltaproteobacteria bacterium]|nr:hypothetical protein [Deltaproteobacteria bacterium]